MTYLQLAEMILALSKEQQGQTLTIFVPGIDEYYPARAMITDSSCDVLDPNHVVITPENI